MKTGAGSGWLAEIFGVRGYMLDEPPRRGLRSAYSLRARQYRTRAGRRWRPEGRRTGIPVRLCRPIFSALLPMLIGCSFLPPAQAQFSQQGNKLLASDSVGFAAEGASVAVSADGNTAIVGGRVSAGRYR